MQPQEGESLDSYTRRCVRALVRSGMVQDGQEAVAICQARWREDRHAIRDRDTGRPVLRVQAGR